MTGMRKGWAYRRGDIYIANLNPRKGSEQGGTRPVLVLSNNNGNFFSSNIIITPLSSRLKKMNLPTHVLIKKGHGLRIDSVAELEFIYTISKKRVKRYIGKISPEIMPEIDKAALISLKLYHPEMWKYIVWMERGTKNGGKNDGSSYGI